MEDSDRDYHRGLSEGPDWGTQKLAQKGKQKLNDLVQIVPLMSDHGATSIDMCGAASTRLTTLTLSDLFGPRPVPSVHTLFQPSFVIRITKLPLQS